MSSLFCSSRLLGGEKYHNRGTFLTQYCQRVGNRFLLHSPILQFQVQTCSNRYSYLHQYRLTIMIQCYFIVILMVYSAPLVIESTPIRIDDSIPQPDPLARKPPKPPFLPEFNGPWARRIQWLILFLQIFLMGILAGLIISVMGVDKMHLRIWAKTGGEKQRSIADLHTSTYTTNIL